MNETNKIPLHWSFWLIAALSLIWNGLGCVNYIVQLQPDAISAYRETEQAIIVNRPVWATFGFALAVFAGAIGSFLLLIRRKICYWFFLASLLGVIITMLHVLTIDAAVNTAELAGIAVMPFMVALILVWYARKSRRNGWLR